MKSGESICEHSFIFNSLCYFSINFKIPLLVKKNKTVIIYSCKPLQSIIRINVGNELITSEMKTPISLHW